jgi:hypothetical protein
MAFSINTLAKGAGADVFYTDDFRNVLEDYMTILRNSSDTVTITVEPATALKYRGDLYGLLVELNYPPYMAWIIMRMNNMNSPVDYDETILTLLTPSEDRISRIRSTYMTQNAISY